ncbi:hypothetical protein [Blastococcus tunisiensis]|uniref:Uncharacterized protein n=1 Tax=Blastococcus tunisiensis TaxID=1798228 RepID=A0A1I2KAL0_9ACTN|nr:hypothetical protein [Blastococcus sp. DSM 46838]SFF61966.1 hypothetical protein SAMN05216574_11973 [Blastococcus sp. DSM 46838]
METWSGLLGAAVGGLIAGLVAWLQTRASIRHQFDLFRQGLEADRQGGRTAFRRAAASDALRALAILDAAMPHMDHRLSRLRQDSPGYVIKRREQAELALGELRRAELSTVPSLGADVQQQWHALIVAADTASRAGNSMGDEACSAAAAALQEEASSMHADLVALTDAQ